MAAPLDRRTTTGRRRAALVVVAGAVSLLGFAGPADAAPSSHGGRPGHASHGGAHDAGKAPSHARADATPASRTDGGPGRSGDAPGRSGDAPGRSSDAPGRSGDAPRRGSDRSEQPPADPTPVGPGSAPAPQPAPAPPRDEQPAPAEPAPARPTPAPGGDADAPSGPPTTEEPATRPTEEPAPATTTPSRPDATAPRSGATGPVGVVTSQAPPPTPTRPPSTLDLLRRSLEATGSSAGNALRDEVGDAATEAARRLRAGLDTAPPTPYPARDLAIPAGLLALLGAYLAASRWLDRGGLPMALPEGQGDDVQHVL